MIPPSHASYRAIRFFPSLDGLRCASIVAVIWHHTDNAIPGIPMSQRGFLGVDMFFVLSGFLIVTLILRERERKGEFSLRGFYARRVLRIFPLYYGVILALTAAFILKPGSDLAPGFLAALPYFLTYTLNWYAGETFFHVAWSLCAEEQFYAIWPPIERLFRGPALMTVLLGVLAVNILVNFGLMDGPIREWFGVERSSLVFLETAFTPICLGVLLAHVLHSERGFGPVARVAGHPWAPAALAGALVVAMNIPAGDIGGPIRFAIHLTMTALLASVVIQERHVLARLLCWAPIRRLGMVSYGMYLWHHLAMWPLIVLLQRMDIPQRHVLFVPAMAATWIFAELSFRYYESPFLKIKERFAA